MVRWGKGRKFWGQTLSLQRVAGVTNSRRVLQTRPLEQGIARDDEGALSGVDPLLE